MNDKPICLGCKHRMVVKFSVKGQANVRSGNGQIIQPLGPVHEEVINHACKLANVPVLDNPCVLECSEFEPVAFEPKLRKPVEERVAQ